jgi:hypothetical protein
MGAIPVPSSLSMMDIVMMSSPSHPLLFLHLQHPLVIVAAVAAISINPHRREGYPPTARTAFLDDTCRSPNRKEMLQKLHFHPPKNEAATQSPGRFRPAQHNNSLIVTLLRGATRWNGFLPSPGHKTPPLSYRPQTQKKSIFPLLKTKPPHDPPVDFDRANAVTC